jgi:hypothetical protein
MSRQIRGLLAACFDFVMHDGRYILRRTPPIFFSPFSLSLSHYPSLELSILLGISAARSLVGKVRVPSAASFAHTAPFFGRSFTATDASTRKVAAHLFLGCSTFDNYCYDLN